MLALAANLERTVRLFGDRIAVLESNGHRFSWAEFADRARCCASLLRESGLKPGDRFAIICHNSFRNAELMRGGYWAGLVPVPINYRLAPPEIAYILDDAECRLVVLDESFAALMASAELAPWTDRVLPLEKERYEQWLGEVKAAPMHEVAETDDALLVYTGGTTGRAKGVRLTHANIMFNALQIAFVAKPRPEDLFLHVAPMFHSADLLSTPWVMAGAAHLYLPDFSGRAALQAIQEHRVTCSVLTPTMIIMMLQEPDFDSYDLSSLRQVIYGSSPMAAEWIQRSLQRFPGVEFIQAYGLTETAAQTTYLPPKDHDPKGNERMKSAGKALPNIQIRIVDENGRSLPTGEIGEICIKSPANMIGYWKLPEETAKTIRNGWVHSGDAGYMDEDGYVYIHDRIKDMIVSGGENIYPAEVENAIYGHPAVADVAVIGVPDDKWGEAVKAVVVMVPEQQCTAEELIAYAKERIAAYKAPKSVDFVDALPRNPSGKILKKDLRAKYWKGSERMV